MNISSFHRRIAAGAIAIFPLAFGTSASAQSLPPLNITGTPSMGSLGDPANAQIIIPWTPGQTITGLQWNVTLTTAGSSWLSEVSLMIRNPTNTSSYIFQPGAGDNFSGTMSYASTGIQPITPVTFGASDTALVLEFFDTFDDVAGADAIWAGGFRGESFITIHYIPAPGACVLMALLPAALFRRRVIRQ